VVCVQTDENDVITGVTIGGRDSWVMMGHVYFDRTFAQHFLRYLLDAHDREDTRDLFWEDIYLDHLDVLEMKARKYREGEIFEFDSLDDLRSFDPSYLDDSRSPILRNIAATLSCRERDIHSIVPVKDGDGLVLGFQFLINGEPFVYRYNDSSIKRLSGALTS
jgi:hypothetical protein